MEHDNTNRGAIWPNQNKSTDRHPDFTGQLNVNGVEYWVSAWKRKEGENPKSPSLRFSIQPKEQKQQAAPSFAKPQQAPAQDTFTDDIPF